MGYIADFFSNIYLLGGFALVLAYFLSIKMIPGIIYLANMKGLMDEPGARSMHIKNTPNLGGVAIFIAFLLTILVIGSLNNFLQPDFQKLLVLLAAVAILFFLGVKDDLVGLSPTKKFIGQGIAAILVVLITDVRIFSFEGLFGIWELPYLVSVLFSVLVFVFIVNAFNLIDGIDGLAGTIGIISSTLFGVFFLINENYMLVLVSLILVGALIGFLRFNLSENQKLFMGDSGSMFIGLLLTYQAICFLGCQDPFVSPYIVLNAPILILAILSFPILDTLRVFIIRIAQHRSPFSADRNHIHHRLTDIGLSHKQSVILIAIANVLVVGLAFFIKDLNINLQFLIMFTVIPALGLLPFVLERVKGRIRLHTPNLRGAH